jgi:hypothetical protein
VSKIRGTPRRQCRRRCRLIKLKAKKLLTPLKTRQASKYDPYFQYANVYSFKYCALSPQELNGILGTSMHIP